MEEDDNLFNEQDNSEEPRWRRLDIADRQELLSNVFSEDDEWYDGAPYYKGGTQNPDFNGIVRACGAPLKEVKRYYVAWLKKKGCDPKAAMMMEKEKNQSSSPMESNQPPQSTYNSPQAPPVQLSPMMGTDGPDPMDQMMMNNMQNAEKGSDSSNMMFMMHFLTSQQRMQMQQQQWQSQLMMQQRQGDQQREGDMRREQMARDQQFMSQQTTLLRESFKRAGDTGVSGKIQQAYEEKMIDELVNGKDSSWKEDIKEVLSSDTLKSAVSGLGTALTNKATQVPAGYDVPNYNPYAQEVHQPVQQVQQHYQPAPPQPEGVFFDEEPLEIQQPIPQQQVPQEVSKDEYKQVLFNSFKDMLGAAMQDPQVAAAVQTQIDVAVDITLLEIPEALPQFKLQRMSEKMLLVRNLRDICFGLRDLRSRVPQGSPPNGIVMAAVISELRQRPEFYKIFAENNYESLVSQLDPFKDTGAIRFDYDYLLKPEIAEIARHMLNSVAQDAQTNGIPATEVQ